MISQEEVLEVQKKWSDGLVKIAVKHQENKDYITEASDFIDSVYAYNLGKVLFKPTLAINPQFRLTKKSALSYFVGGDSGFPEDTGFALKGWKTIRWENEAIKLEGNIAICMGNYFFGKENEEDLKVEYSFVFKKLVNGEIKIILHDSHFPYKK